jgi:hypothetical protein
MARSLSFGMALLASMLLLLMSCNSPDEGGGTDASPTASSSNGNNNGNGNGNNGNGGSGGFSYLPWGPDDPPIPGQYAAFAATSSQDLRCESVDSEAPGGAFWDLAAAVCRAIRDNAGWPSTTTVPKPPDTPNAIQDCLDTELAAMLKRALHWHADNPGKQPEISYPSASAMSPCRYRIYNVQLITDEHTGAAIAVKITVPAGTEAFTVTVDEQHVNDDDVDNTQQDNGLNELVVWLKASSEPRTIRLAVSNGRGTDSTSVDLPSASNTSSPSATDSPASPGSPSVIEDATSLAESGGATGAISALHLPDD